MNRTNPMQAHLGLSAGPVDNSSVFGPPTPGLPPIRTPGQMSQELMEQAMAARNATVQAAQVSMPANPLGVGGGFPGGGPLGAFASQYHMNMTGIASQQFNPYMAQAMAGVGGFSGFNQGMMASPVMMTSPHMGIFRSFPPAPPASVPPVPQLPLIRTPLTPELPSPSFQSPLEYDHAIGIQRSQQFTGAALAAPGLAGRGAVDVGAGVLTSLVGSYAGARLGGRVGAAVGSLTGLGVGLYGAERSGLGEGTQTLLDNINPLRQTAIRAQQMRGMTRDFVVGGSEMDLMGRGLDNRASAHLGRLVEDRAWSERFRRETGTNMSTQDLTRIAQTAGSNGMLDMSQNAGDIRQRVTEIAKAVSSFMQLANEPDLQEAMRRISQMRHMGLSLGETHQFVQNARMYARQAGLSVGNLMEQGGLQGAMTFQGQGLSAGLGMLVGAGSLGFARQAVAAGTFNEAQLAMFGGVTGVAQREMESSAAFLRQPTLAAAMSTMSPEGSFRLDTRNIMRLARGDMNISDLASAGANNLLDAVSQQGAGALGLFQMQQGELQDQIGRALGPEGLHIVKMQQILGTQRMLGLEGVGGFFTAARSMGMDATSANQMTRMAVSPGAYEDMLRQLQVQQMDSHSLEMQGRERQGSTGLFGRIIGERGRNFLQDIGTPLASTARDFGEGFSGFFAEFTEDRALRRRGFRSRRTPRNLIARNQAERDLIDAPMDEDSFRDFMQSLRQFEDEPYDTVGERRDQLQAMGGWSAIGGSIHGLLPDGMRSGRFSMPTLSGDLDTEFLRDDGASRASSGKSMMRGLAASSSAQRDALSRMGEALGSTDAANRVSVRFAMLQAEEARNRSNLILPDEIGSRREARENLLFQAARLEGIEDPTSLSLEDADLASARLARSLGGESGASYFRSLTHTDDGRRRQLLEGIQASDLTDRRDLFGDSLGGGRLAEEALSTMFGRADPRAAALAALMADPNSRDQLREYMGHLGEDRIGLEREAMGIRDRAREGGWEAHLRRSGRQFGQLSAEQVDEHAELLGARYGFHRRATRLHDGLSSMLRGVRDPSLVDTALTEGGYEALLRMSSADAGALSGRAQEIVEEFHSSGVTEGRRQALGDEFIRLADSRGAVTQTGAVSREMTPGGVGFDDRAMNVAEFSSLMRSEFPDAVKTFDKAAKALNDAADRLGNRTILPGVNISFGGSGG